MKNLGRTALRLACAGGLLLLEALTAARADELAHLVFELKVERRETLTGLDPAFVPYTTELKLDFDPTWTGTEIYDHLAQVSFAGNNRFTSPLTATLPWTPPTDFPPERRLAMFMNWVNPPMGGMFWDDRYRYNDTAAQREYSYGISLDTNPAANGPFQSDIASFKAAELIAFLDKTRRDGAPIAFAEDGWVWDYANLQYLEHVNYGGTARIKTLIPPDSIPVTPPPPGEPPPALVPKPIAMLVMSRDQQYFFKAYNDFSDLDGDGEPETTYEDAFEYYGYFHGQRCYRYSSVDNTFHAAGVTTGTHAHYCEGSLDDTWSGNFLNWATMTRMDVVRKALYGGLRSTDTATATVLERAHLPTDAHAFAKYYNGADLAKLVPYAVGSTQSATTPLVVDATSTSATNVFGRDDANEGITICNASPDPATTTSSQSTMQPPLLRAAAGNYQLWALNERWQCTWNDEPTTLHTVPGGNTNGNIAAYSGLFAASSDPGTAQALKTPGGARDHVVRAAVCEPTFFDPAHNRENCTAYGTNLKPEGVLQRYGLKNEIAFGLITGSFHKNVSGGVLRKNQGPLTNEFDATTGVFLNLPAPGIIGTLNALRVWGYGYKNGTYRGDDSTGGENCDWQLTDILTTGGGPGEGKCASWGNPFSEIYLEALHYYAAGGTRMATPAFDTTDTTYFPGLRTDTWSLPPLTDANDCASLNIVGVNAGINSYDDDQTALYTASNPVTATNAIGDGEGVSGHDFLVGRTAVNANETCTAKTVSALGSTFGICPETPTLRGSYHVAGLAYYAHTHDLRTDLAGRQAVTTYGLPIAPNHPEIDVPIGPAGTALRHVRILPAYRFLRGSSAIPPDPTKDGGGSLVDFRIVQRHIEVASMTDKVAGYSGGRYFYGKFLIAWDDSEQGGDFDQDMWGTLEYHVDTATNQVLVTTTAVAQSTSIGQLFGFVVTGTTKDGFHAYSGILGATFVDATGVTGCANCRALSETGGQRGAQSYTFDVSTSGASTLLRDPLYYAAKWGGFVDLNGNGVPDEPTEWDSADVQGNAGTPDGIPDTFFPLADPGRLEAAFVTAFDRIHARAVPDWRTCAGADTDADGIPDLYDNCRLVPNANQRDSNQDGYGNVCDADFDGSGLVNLADLAYFKQHFGTHDADADFNGDGLVNLVDLAKFKELYGKPPGPKAFK